ncbi:MAG: hypothetical protein V3W31_04630 [Thermodesulfobacteriota bacterium]
MLLLDNSKVRVEYSPLDSRLYIFKGGRYVGSEYLLECVRHLLDDDPLEEYEREELHSGDYMV